MAFSQKEYIEQKARLNQLRLAIGGDGKSLTLPIKRIGSALRLDPRVDEEKQEILRWIMTVMAEIEKTLGDDKKDLTNCVPESYVQAMIDAATIGIPIDGRKLADLVPRGGMIQYQINTAGFVYLVGLHYKGANFKSGVVFEGDEFRVWSENGQDHYTHNIGEGNAFADDPSKVQGIYVALTYIKDGIQHQKVERLSSAEIRKIRGKAKQDYIWKEWFLERAQTAAIKRIAKRQFQTIMGLQTAIEYDNKRNFDLNRALPAPSAGTIIDNLNARLAPPKQDIAALPEPEKHETVPLEPEQKQETVFKCNICGDTGYIDEEADGQTWKENCPQCGASAADRQTDQKALF